MVSVPPGGGGNRHLVTVPPGVGGKPSSLGGGGVLCYEKWASTPLKNKLPHHGTRRVAPSFHGLAHPPEHAHTVCRFCFHDASWHRTHIFCHLPGPAHTQTQIARNGTTRYWTATMSTELSVDKRQRPHTHTHTYRCTSLGMRYNLHASKACTNCNHKIEFTMQSSGREMLDKLK